MEIVERTVSDVTVLDLKGKMTLGEGDELLKDKINSLLASGKKKLLLNLEAVPYIDSAGLGEVVRTYTTVSRQGGSLKLLSLTKKARRGCDSLAYLSSHSGSHPTWRSRDRVTWTAESEREGVTNRWPR